MKYVTSFERSGRLLEALSLVTRQLNRRLGTIDEALVDQVRSLTIEELEALGEALLDFTSVTDLTNWLSGRQQNLCLKASPSVTILGLPKIEWIIFVCVG